MKKLLPIALVLSYSVVSAQVPKVPIMSTLFGSKKVQYELMDFESMIKRYFEKEIGDFNSLEGIYSVSCTITKTGRNIFGEERERVVARRDNYARIAILKDYKGSKREFIEVSLSYREATKYPIVGELTTMVEGGGLVYKHLEPDGSTLNFSMIFEPNDLIEGEYAFTKGRKIIRYKLSYLKIYPKTHNIAIGRD